MNYQDPNAFEEDANSRVAAYESYLDLFTLLSFILIISAFIYVTKSDQLEPNPEKSFSAVQPNIENKTSTPIVARTAKNGSGAPQKFPQDRLLLVIFRRDSIDRISVIDGIGSSTNEFLIAAGNINEVMADLTPKFNKAKTIDIAVYQTKKEDINPSVFLEVSRWLADRNYKNRIYFSKEDGK